MTAQTFLITPVIDDAAGFAPLLRATLERTGAVSVLLRLVPSDERAAVNRVKLLAPVAQALGAAVLVENEPAVAIRGGADGVHVAGDAAALRAAIDRLKPDRIVGAGRLATRHAAMEAGEAGADYVMFGEPFPGPGGAEAWPPLDGILARAAWWTPIFETPCVACAPSAEAVAALAATGAEFVALGPWAFRQD